MVLEVAVATSEVPGAQAVLEQSWFAGADESDIAFVNHDAGGPLTCPACGSESPAESEECTDCGLRL